MERYGVNVKKTVLQPREKQSNLQNLMSPHGLQPGRNTIPCDKLLIAQNKKSCMRKIKLLLPEYYQKCACNKS